MAAEIIAIKNARLFDPSSDLDEKGDLLIENGKIAALGAGLFKKTPPPREASLIDASGDLLLAGVFDMQVHSGEPGGEHRETLPSLIAAALAGGVTDMLLMPDTNPPIDEASLMDFLKRREREASGVHFHLAGALTKGLEGKHLSEMSLLQSVGARAFCDAHYGIQNALVMRHAMTYAADLNIPIMNQPQDPSLAREGVMHEGWVSARLGLVGIPWAAETIMLARDLSLAEMTGARYHAMQLSSRHALPLIREAKKKGLPISCGVSVHHLLLDEETIGAYRTFLKLTPPLREKEDREALLEAVADGVIDVILSGHNPQTPETKRLPFAQAAFGSVGLETLLPAILTLHEESQIPLAKLVDCVVAAPRRILGLEERTLSKGMAANLVLCRLGEAWNLDAETLKSKSTNTALDGYRFQGKVRLAISDGKVRFGA